jgi:hypothetical protein
VRGRVAQITPTGTATSIHTTNAPTVSEIVAGSRATISDRTETWFWYE